MGFSETMFSDDVAERLRYYVYRLIDPRNGETFYVGKGRGNRVFAHIRAEQNLEGDPLENKLTRIHRIRLAGFEVAHVIHRHGMDERTAFEVEAALIDAYPGLTNKVGGHHGSEFGTMHADEIIRRYAAEPAVFKHKALLISVNQSSAEISPYEATRYAWKISKVKAEQADVILATVRGLIVAAYVAEEWLEATEANFPGREPAPGRWGFVGREAPPALWSLYVGKRVPDEYRRAGASNPIKYTWTSNAKPESAGPAAFRHKAMLIGINRSAAENSVYEATRYAWKVSRARAEEAEVILATVQGLIVGAFVADQWLEAIPKNFPGREPYPGRFGFIGHEAPEHIAKLYVDKRVPDEFRKRGAANPIKYTWQAVQRATLQEAAATS